MRDLRTPRAKYERPNMGDYSIDGSAFYTKLSSYSSSLTSLSLPPLPPSLSPALRTLIRIIL